MKIGNRNAQAFERTVGHRTVIPDEFGPERIIREAATPVSTSTMTMPPAFHDHR